MAILGFGAKKQASGGGAQEIKRACGDPHSTEKNARFIVLGACCQRSADTFANVKQAVSALAFADEVLNIGDAAEIARYGVMQTPALVIDGKVVSCGKLIQVNEAKRLIEKAGVTP